MPGSLTYLICSGNKLKSLKGCPESVVFLDCHCNQLTTLIGCPKSVTHLYCSNNKLTTLVGCPDVLIDLDCEDNPLSKLYKRYKLEQIPKINRYIHSVQIFLLLSRKIAIEHDIFDMNKIALLNHSK